jgi:hypothetical protein
MHFEEENRAMSDITILSKQPPGGRCSLYLRYADALRKKPGLEVEVAELGRLLETTQEQWMEEWSND